MHLAWRWAVLALADLSATTAFAQVCPVDWCVRGTGRPLRVECLLQWAGVRATTVACVDGAACDLDRAANGACRFAVAPCVDLGGCVVEPAPPIANVVVAPAAEPAAGTLRDAIRDLAATSPGPPRCASPVTIDVPVGRGRRPDGRVRLRVAAKAPRMRDRDRLTFRCWPAGTGPAFATDVAPVLAASCTPGCHEPGGRSSFLELASAAAYLAVVPLWVEPGHPRRSRLYDVLRRSMPPGCHRSLPPEYSPGGCPTRDEIDLVADWIRLGAPDD